MRVREYLEKVNCSQITFIKARARKDARSPYYHSEYQTTPIYSSWELEESRLMDYIILNHNQAPIDWLSGSNWGLHFNKGILKSLLVISEEDLALLYRGEEQRKHMIEFIDKKILKELENE